jgi:hypothetical protein
LLALESPYKLRRLSDSLLGKVWFESGLSADFWLKYSPFVPFDKGVLGLLFEGLRGDKFAGACITVSNFVKVPHTVERRDSRS